MTHMYLATDSFQAVHSFSAREKAEDFALYHNTLPKKKRQRKKMRVAHDSVAGDVELLKYQVCYAPKGLNYGDSSFFKSEYSISRVSNCAGCKCEEWSTCFVTNGHVEVCDAYFWARYEEEAEELALSLIRHLQDGSMPVVQQCYDTNSRFFISKTKNLRLIFTEVKNEIWGDWYRVVQDLIDG